MTPRQLPLAGTSSGAGSDVRRGGTDVLSWPVVGPLLKRPGSRAVLQLPLLALAAFMVWHGLAGPETGSRNAATVLTWVHYRGALILGLLAAGNVFCMACPFMLPRNLARKLVRPVRHWPAALRNKWTAVVLLATLLFSYELFDLWNSPWWTAWLIVAYFAGALIVDSLFTGASFCKYVCPLGQFNFVSSTVSPLELSVDDPEVCESCETRDCIKGTPDPEGGPRPLRRGCELALFQPEKHGNMDCTLCLDCVYACPHDNIKLSPRLPASELWSDRRRSGVGRFSRRADLGALVLIFTFGALLNAFGMVSPVHAVQSWIGGVLGTESEAAVLGALFGAGLVVEPVVLLLGASWATRRMTGGEDGLLRVATTFAYALVPLGVAVWAAHYSFHALAGLWTFVPVVQEALGSLGIPFLGAPAWHLRGIPTELVLPLEYGVVALGIAGSLAVARRIAAREYPRRSRRAALPWTALVLVLGGAALWLLAQPMEMRGMMMG